MAKCPICGSDMTDWFTQLIGSNPGEQIRLCRNEKGQSCRVKQKRMAPKRIRDKIRRRWRTEIVNDNEDQL